MLLMFLKPTYVAGGGGGGTPGPYWGIKLGA